jgi:hypothetical protein
MGAIPWVALQLMLVVVVIFFPQTVTVFLDKEQAIDIDKVKIEVPSGGSSYERNQNLDELFKTQPAEPAASSGK